MKKLKIFAIFLIAIIVCGYVAFEIPLLPDELLHGEKE